MATDSPAQETLPGLPDRLALEADTLAARLDRLGLTGPASRLRRCQTPGTIRVCASCRTRYPLPWHCNQRICPWCQRRTAAIRASTLRCLLPLLSQPKHVVLTVRNPQAISLQYLRRLQSRLRQLRRGAYPTKWGSGTWSLEITNESRGWHPHYHLLVDTPWIDAETLARRWARLVGQEDYAIVAVKAIRNTDYVEEVCKYVAKPDQIAHWTDDELLHYLEAIKRVRAWGTWGQARRAWRRAEALARALRRDEWHCQVCGSTQATFDRPIPGVEITRDPKPYGLVN